MAKGMKTAPVPVNEPLWYKDAIVYQLHVKTFFDSDGDGIGDFKGLTGKLDYLQNLGITAVWLLPFYPSPLKDDGYDIADYTGIHPAYGTMRDFRVFLREAHRRKLRVITELVVNHTSDQHPWFQQARRAKKGTSHRNFYVWSDTALRYSEARIIFQDFETSNWTWDHTADAYYWHRFYSHQPDLNYDNPAVHRAVLKALDFWLEMGVDGLRLDALPYLYEREGTNCENLPETHAFLKKLRGHMDRRYSDRMLLGEANQWPEDAVAYFGEGDESHMAFHFPLMPRLFMALRMEDRFPLIDILDQTPTIPENCQWAVFLRNHDELTLEMVTDEERDYMYRVYAQDPQMRLNLGIRRRLAPLLGNHRRRIELMNGILFSLTGTPVIYYGDEIGMGDNIYLGDRNGVRTPMQWNDDRNAGFSRANPHRLYLPVIIDPEYHYEVINVQSQQNNLHSSLWWMKRLIALRRRFRAFGRGATRFLRPSNHRILAFVRSYRDERILVAANLSRFVQYAELDLSEFMGAVPVEIFGGTEFPVIGAAPFPLTLSPHAFYWFILASPKAGLESGTRVSASPVELAADGKWESIFSERKRDRLEAVIAAFIPGRRWFGGKARRVKSISVAESIPFQQEGFHAYILFVSVDYTDGSSETYVLPVAYAAGPKAENLLKMEPQAVLARVRPASGDEEGVLYDPTTDKGFGKALLSGLLRRSRWRGNAGELYAAPTPALRNIVSGQDLALEPSPLRGEQSNTSVVYGEKLILKLYRRLQPGINPDLEIGRFLTLKGFAHVPPVAGALEYKSGGGEPTTLAVFQGYVPNRGDAWSYTLGFLNGFLETVVAQRGGQKAPEAPSIGPIHLTSMEPPEKVREAFGHYAESARLLGRRTAELHRVLASAGEEDRPFAPEPFSKLYQRSLYQSMRTLTGKNFLLLRLRLDALPGTIRREAEEVLSLETEILARFHAILDLKITAMRLRCHGDYHLGQVLQTERDFVIIDFEGEPARPITERKIKRSPLRDVAGMLRSFHYVMYSAVLGLAERGLLRAEEIPELEPWVEFWHRWAGAIFLSGYLDSCKGAGFLPETEKELEVLLDVFLIEKAVYELGYELDNRPDWVRIPLKGIQSLLRPAG